MKINTMKLKLTALLLVLYTGLYAQNKIVLTAPRLDTSSLSNRINLKANTNLNNVNGVLSSTYGGAGSVSGILKANGTGTVSAAVAGTDYVIPSALSGYLPLSGGTLTGALSGTSLSMSGGGRFGTGLAVGADLMTSADNINIAMPNGSNIQSRINLGTPQIAISTNVEGDWFSPTYKVSNYAGQVYIDGNQGIIGLRTAASGTSGATLTWNTPALLVHPDNSVTINTTTTDGTNKLIVNGGVKGTKGNFTGSAGETFTVSGVIGEWSQRITASSSTNNSFGLIVNGGTSTSDIAFKVTSQSGGTDYLVTRGDGLTTARKMVVSGGSGELLTINGAVGEWASRVIGSSSSGNSYGLVINAGTSASDFAMNVTNQAVTTSLFNIKGDGAATFIGSVAASAFTSSTITLSNSGSGAIQMTGASADIWVNNASGTFRIVNQAYTLENFTVSQAGNGFFRGSTTANSFVKSGGTSSQFLKADGSVDGNTYITSASVGDGTLTLAVSGSGLSGSQTFTANQSSNATFTVTSNATTAATASTIAYRDGSGNLNAVGFFETSDKRKKDIFSVTKEADGIDFVGFKWKKELNLDNKKHLGVIAQQVEKVLPDAVNTDEKGDKSVNYTEVLLFKLENLTKKVEELERKLERYSKKAKK